MNVAGRLVGYAGVLAVAFAAAYAVGDAMPPVGPPNPTPAVQQMPAPAGVGVGSDVAGEQRGEAAAPWRGGPEGAR